MPDMQMLRAVVQQRLAAAAEEIFRLFEGAMVEYEAEKEHQHSLLEACTAPKRAEAAPPVCSNQLRIRGNQQAPGQHPLPDTGTCSVGVRGAG
ncbi:uncharacterized protein LOC133460983 isoform X3 [Cololabis saira]|uniref:uncharacterized protein LOC133460983 isoform X3 n=1 Tax=Cololabis saira TaxID=129043 RepID=UPI002AD35293|nr:uncharacterized protein LOC133460983 isoform X3 [Cololabis saira]